MDKKSIWNEKYHVFWHDTDKTGKMSFAALFRYLQETAWKHAEHLGFGYNRASELNQFWVLVRQLVKMDRFPVWGEPIEIETWPRGVDGIWAFRDYRINDSNGNRMGGVASSWMVVDMKTHRPHKPELVLHALPLVKDEMALGEPADKVTFRGLGNQIDSRIVRFSDMDNNGHVNNSKYVEWALDALSLNRKMKSFSNIHINFLSEAKEGEVVVLSLNSMNDTLQIKGTRKSDDRDIFVAAFSE